MSATAELAEVEYAGWRCLRLGNGTLAVYVLLDAGPRVIGLEYRGGQNLLAVVPEALIETPGAPSYRFRGGHRLWTAPEIPAVTYRPDDDPVEVDTVPGGVRSSGAVDVVTKLRKRLTVTIPEPGSTVVLDHVIENQGSSTSELAIWALTQLPLGGDAWLPQPEQPADPGGLRPNRTIVLWPYSRLTDPRLHLADPLVRLEARDAGTPFKVGWPNARRWMAYRRDGTLFVKRAPHDDDAEHVDFGASAQCYVDERFIELETLGPRVRLAPGATARHRELWEVYEIDDAMDVDAVIADLDLDTGPPALDGG